MSLATSVLSWFPPGNAARNIPPTTADTLEAPSGVPRVPARRRGKPWVKSTIRVTRDTWRSWAGLISTRPKRLYCDDAGGPWRSPRSLADLQAIVQDARAEGVSVRVFGSSHSWAALVPNDSGYVVDNRMIGAEDGHYTMTVEPPRPGRKARATVPPGAISSEFEEWLWDMGYTLPVSAFEDCFTMGGMAATATHGTSKDFGTLSDLVVGVTFVDGLGNVRRWTRETATEDELTAAQCSLGCLGLVYSLTFEVEPRYEVLHEARSFPIDSLFADTDAARENLRRLHEEHDSIEFFWWPTRFSGVPGLSAPELNPDIWVLSTRRDGAAAARPRSELRRFVDHQIIDLGTFVPAGLGMRPLVKSTQGLKLLGWLTCFSNAWGLVRNGAWRIPQYQANHFVNAGGVEFILNVACEWSVPFRRNAPLDAPDGYERLRQCFARIHGMVQDAFTRYPAGDPRRIPITIGFEMRMLRSSSALLSPGYQPADKRDEYWIAAPEIVTMAEHPAWPDFVERANIELLTNTAVFGDQVRCHQAKPCHGYPHPDYPTGSTADYLRDQYRRAGTWDRFLAVRRDVDPDGVFLNPYLRSWFFGETPAVGASADAGEAEQRATRPAER